MDMKSTYSTKTQEGTCEVCGNSSICISKILKVCADCIRDDFDGAKPYLETAHEITRNDYNLPSKPPKDPEGVKCKMCGNECRISQGGEGFCATVENIDGKLVRKIGSEEKGLGDWYYDSIPTNCVSAWCCAGSSGAGYPEWCHTPQGDIGNKNLAVFLGSCTYDCVYCQNSHFRKMTEKGQPVMSAEGLANKVEEDVSCVCYFGGDPASQMPFVIESAKIAKNKVEKEERILRFCLETNLSMNSKSLREFADLSIESGGGIKADLKCWSTEILYALSGVDHRRAYENFEMIGSRQKERPEVPFARASTLLVPSYVDDHEIRKIASFIADIDPTIPYSLLAFSPSYHMLDLPHVEREKIEDFLDICEEEGLENVRVGNRWLID